MMMTELSIALQLNSQQFSSMLDITFKCLTEKQQVKQYFPLYKTFCENNDVDFSTVEPLIKLLIQTAKDAARKNKTVIQLHEELLKLGLNEDQVQIFLKQWENTFTSIAQPIAETLPINPLLDMEWKFGVSSASNQLNTIGNVFLQMKLEVGQGGEQSKTVFFELQLSEFYAFLHEMEKARASLDYLS